MNVKSYGNKLRDPRWQRLRLEIMQRDNFSCQLCGDSKSTLNIHHLKYLKEPWDCPPQYLITLCEDCHQIITLQQIDLNNNTVEIRKLHRSTHMSYICLSNEGAMFYMKDNRKSITCHGGVSHEVLRYVVHDIINYWLRTEKDHYLTDKLIEAHG